MTEVNLHPGQSISPDQEKNVLLAGGFPALFPGTDFPLSPTLQLNSDRGTLSNDSLARLATAELERINRISYRSYHIEPDNRVCVIGDSRGKLNSFIDTYGGVLEIESLLLKGHDPDIPTVTELNMEARGSGLRLEYLVRLPIRIDLCTYCGACGPACPENCISPDLFLDFGVCTLCKECEPVCEVRAIDVNRVESQTMEVPALIILDGVEVELEEGSSSVYYERDLKDYFAALFSYRIDEVVACDRSICQYSGRLGVGCSLCLSSCTFGAVSQGAEGVTVDGSKCEECGACVSVCPTGAMQNRRFDDESFVEFFRNIDLLTDSVVVVGDEQSLHALWWGTKGKRFDKVFFLEYSQVQSLSLFHFMFLLRRGAGKVFLLSDTSGGTELSRQVALANSLVTSLYNTTERIVIYKTEEVEQYLSRDQQTEALVSNDEQRPFVNRRRELSAALQSLVANSGKVADVRPGDYISFATLTCNRDRCTQCMACLNDCRIQALSADEEQLTLNHIGSMCVACGICVHVCPEDALELSPRFKLNTRFFKPVEMAKAEPMACKSCGKVFGTRKSFERVMAILSQKETVDISHFEYCDTCRVVKLFESQ